MRVYPTYKVLNQVILLFLTMAVSSTVAAQNTPKYGHSDPSEIHDCGIYQWPEVQSPCPEVQIKQKHDHTPQKQYRAQGWDTVVTCAQQSLVLSCMPYMPVQFFNGKYTVDTIAYNPPDTTFAMGNKMPVSTDDDFATEKTDLPFSFFFFGIEKKSFVLGANGLITFDTTSAGKYCPWKFSASLPWPDKTKGAPSGLGCTIGNMRDAIYGIYEDTHPIASYLNGDQGIYYGVQDETPCQKIICSWNGIPTFPGSRNKNNRCTYQIVCYEGSNIIEIHIKRRGINSKWQNGNGLIGIQNATGEPQEKGDVESSTRLVENGAWPDYWPENANLLTDSLENIAFRFTPQGRTATSYHWYRIFDDGRDSVDLPSIIDGVNDTNGYYIPMGLASTTCPTLTTASVSPTVVSKYVFHLKFRNAAGHMYNLYDTITIGVDTSKVLVLRPSNGTPTDHQMDICVGNNAQMIMEFPQLQDTSEVRWNITRIENGVSIPLPDSLFKFGNMYVDEQTGLKRIPAILTPDAHSLTVTGNESDSIYIHMNADFVSGCNNTTDFLIRIFPSYDTIEEHGICKGDVFHWELNGNDYTTATTAPLVKLSSQNGCDSIVHLDLKVFDVSLTIDEHRDCKPLTWINGKTYYKDNTETMAMDTVVLSNMWGCDSVVQLDFKIQPMTPIIDADRSYFDYDNLDVVLTDVSEGGNGRRWIFPNIPEQTEPTVYYTIPYELDSARILMIESSSFGCVDTAKITIPFRRDVIWMPNIFTPTAEDNNLFGSKSRHLLKEQLKIYNRFGILVFSCDEIDCQWDGTDFEGRACPQGTYVYIIRYTTEYSPFETRILKGTVTILD